MDEDVLCLEIPEKKIKVLGKPFTLVEFPAKDIQKYLELRFKITEIMNKAESQEILSDEATSVNNRLLRMILREEVTDEWLDDLPGSIKGRLVDEQDKLNRVQEILGNVQSLLSLMDNQPKA